MPSSNAPAPRAPLNAPSVDRPDQTADEPNGRRHGEPEAAHSDLLNAEVEVADSELLLSLTGPGGTRLSLIEQTCGVQAGLRGDMIYLHGPRANVRLAERVIGELSTVLRDGASLKDDDLASSARLLRDHPQARLADIFQHVVVTAAGGRQVTPRGLAQKFYVQAIETHDVVFGIGPAGTGKTYLAMATAVAALQSQRVKRIILTRPAVEAGEKLGFLPGDLAEKVNPFLRPLYDALHDMLPAQKVYNLLERGTIEVAPLAFMRGRTLNDSFIILDEAQNTSVPQMRMFLTRVGLRSKAVITGDVTQVDLPDGMSSGLSEAVALLSRVDGLSCCYFTSADVVRHPLVQRIVEAYDGRDERRKAEGGARRSRGGADDERP
jgi:phosphate starvation-inducible PhoH-like protein